LLFLFSFRGKKELVNLVFEKNNRYTERPRFFLFSAPERKRTKKSVIFSFEIQYILTILSTDDLILVPEKTHSQEQKKLRVFLLYCVEFEY